MLVVALTLKESGALARVSLRLLYCATSVACALLWLVERLRHAIFGGELTYTRKYTLESCLHADATRHYRLLRAAILVFLTLLHTWVFI